MFIFAELVGAELANSLAIFTDATHLLSDLSSFGVSALSIVYASKKASPEMSWGFHRAEIIGALVSISIIWILTAWLVWEAVGRLVEPQAVDGLIMMVTAVVGVLCNVVMGRLLHSHSHSHSHSNMNLRAAFIHVIGDFIQSIGVLIAALFIFFEPRWTFIDPICTFFFSVIVICTTLPILRDCFHLIMQKVPKHIDIHQMRKDFLEVSLR